MMMEVFEVSGKGSNFDYKILSFYDDHKYHKNPRNLMIDYDRIAIVCFHEGRWILGFADLL